MNEQELMAFVQRILDNTKYDVQAQCMLRELRGMLDADAQKHPEEKELLKPLDEALRAFPELREVAGPGKKLDSAAIHIANTRANERREREARYNRC